MASLKAAVYVRVSKLDQHPENQEQELLSYCKDRDWHVFKVYTDRISGGKDSRPALNELVKDARRKRFNVVVAWKLDRLGRSLQHLLFVVEEWNKLGIDFVCVTQQIDTTTASGRFTFQILGAVAEFERELIRERINLGLERAKREGKSLGRPKGSKDSKPRRKSGYYVRWSKTDNKKSSPQKRGGVS